MNGHWYEVMWNRLYFIPIPKPKKSSSQIQMDLDSQNRQEENRLINAIRQRVALWRQSGFFPATRLTRRLLEHWTRPDRDRRLFFCKGNDSRSSQRQ